PAAALGTVHGPRRHDVAGRQLRAAEPLPAHADEPLDVTVPGRQVVVADRPIDPGAVAQVGGEVEVAPTPAQPTPDEAAPAQLVAADPAKRLVVGSDVGVLPIVHEEVSGRLAERGVLALDRVVVRVKLLGAPAAQWVRPRP